MTNEDRERLRAIVGLLPYAICADDYDIEDDDLIWAESELLSLIDRQPSEDDLGLIGKFLLWADKTTANLQYKWAIYYIRKALSIEGEE